MPPHAAVFYGTVFFLCGILLKSFFSGSVIFIVGGVFSLVLLIFWRLRTVPFLAVFMPFFLILGAFYYSFYDSLTRPQAVPYGEAREFTAEVVSMRERATYRIATLKILNEKNITVSALLPSLPPAGYGDTLRLKGEILPPEDRASARYLLKDNIFGTMAFPEIYEVSRTREWRPLRFLYAASDYVLASFKRVMPADDAALMAGLTIGSTDDFSAGFKEAMHRSGTTHLVALSGYNVTIIASVLLVFLRFFLSRRQALFAALFAVLVFVLMTGASPSVVRAGLAAALLISLKISGRLRDPKYVVAFVALLMALWNPRVVAFDVGFQLSFAALLGILYILPVLRAGLWGRDRNAPFLFESFGAALAAQLAAVPLLLFYFGNVYASSLIANAAIAIFIPPTMAIGFLIAFFSLLLPPLALLGGFVAVPFLRAESGIIDFFSEHAFLPVSFSVSAVYIGLYYGIMAVLYRYARKRFF